MLSVQRPMFIGNRDERDLATDSFPIIAPNSTVTNRYRTPAQDLDDNGHV